MGMLPFILLCIGLVFYVISIFCSCSGKSKKIMSLTLLVGVIFLILSIIIPIIYVDPVVTDIKMVNVIDKYDCLKYQCRYGYDYHATGSDDITYVTNNKSIYNKIMLGENKLIVDKSWSGNLIMVMDVGGI